MYGATRETGEVSQRKNDILRKEALTDKEMQNYIMDEIDHRVRIDKDVAETVLRLAEMGNLDKAQIKAAVKGAGFGWRRWNLGMMQKRTEIPKETHKGLNKRLLEKYEREKKVDPEGAVKWKYRANYLNEFYRSLDHWRYW